MAKTVNATETRQVLRDTPGSIGHLLPPGLRIPSRLSAFSRWSPNLAEETGIAKGDIVTQTTMAESESPTLLPSPNRPPITKRRKALLSPIVTTLSVIIAGIALIALGTSLATWTGSIASATSESVSGVTTTSGAIEPAAAATEATALETTTTSSDVESPAVAAIASPTTTDVAGIAADVVDSVVTVNVTIDVRGPGDLTGSGSGIVLDADGTIVTNAHVVSDATLVTVTFTDGSTIAAEVVGVDEANDVAVLAVDASDLSPISVGSTAELAVGNPLIAVGNPLGLEGGPSVTVGIVSALGRVLEDGSVSLADVIQTDAAITEGSSGGALLDANGRLVGMTTAVGVSSVGVEGIGFAIPVETVVTAVAQLIPS